MMDSKRTLICYTSLIYFSFTSFIIFSFLFRDVSITYPKPIPKVLNGKDLTAKSLTYPKTTKIKLKKKSEHNSRYLIDTPFCQIPKINPFDDIYEINSEYEKEVSCVDYPKVTYTLGNVLYLNKTALKDAANGTDLLEIRCCYRTLERDDSSDHPDYYISIGEDCIPFEDSVKINEEFIKSECSDNKVIYSNYHTTFVNKQKHQTKNEDRYNILVLGLDSVSKVNLRRMMQKTEKYLREELKSIEMLGYVGLGDNTIQNAVPMLTGKKEKDVIPCYDENHNFDKCGFIWNEFAANGYSTLYAEDSPVISIFDYLRYGFDKQPTDYYLRPSIYAAEDDIGHRTNVNAKLCIGPTLEIDYALKYTSDVFENLKNGSVFGFTWLTSLTHDVLEYAKDADTIIYDFMKKLETSGVLNNTIVFFLSDHGMRWGSIVETVSGKMEERLPFCFLHLPKSFQKKYPKLVEAASENSKVLTSAYDVYSTLMNLIKFKGKGEDSSKWFKSSASRARSKSLFTKISDQRSCTTLDIHPLWCVCNSRERIDTKSEITKKSSEALVKDINLILLASEGKCANLKLKKVINAWSVPNFQLSLDIEDNKNETIEKTYIVEIETYPGEGIFETAVQFDGNEFQFNDEIIRNNLYGNQSHCVSDKFLKKFCYCKDQLLNDDA